MIIKAWMPRYNWGDQINRELAWLITGEWPELVHANTFQAKPHYLCIGSILTYCDPASIVWGSGFLSAEDKLTREPAKICAVRGPLSRAALLKQRVYCPEVYGDPALLLPRFYNPQIRKRHNLGVVLHWGDVNNAKMFKHVILPTSPPFKFIDEILACKAILSSSLHGLIVAEAYGIPADQLVLSEDHYQFKFDDYKESRKYLDLNKLMDVCPFRKGDQ